MVHPSENEGVTALAKNLRRMRHEAGLSQREAARRIGVAHSTLSYWEAGTILPSLRKLACALIVYGRTPSDVFDLVTAHELIRRAA